METLKDLRQTFNNELIAAQITNEKTLAELKAIVTDDVLNDRSLLYKTINGFADQRGHDCSDYTLLEDAGKIKILAIAVIAPKTVTEYINIMGHRLDPTIIDFLKRYHSVIEVDLEATKASNYHHDYFSASTFVNQYSGRPHFNSIPVETPAWMFIRSSLQMYNTIGIGKVQKQFNYLTNRKYTLASPTLFNASTNKPSMLSCFGLVMGDDLHSIMKHGIYTSSMVSKLKGGIGLCVSFLRHSIIDYVGHSSGVIPFLQMFDKMVAYVNQTGMRAGAATFFINDHHIDSMACISAVQKQAASIGQLFNVQGCIWTHNLFWHRVRTNGNWLILCPAQFPQFNGVYGREFDKRFIELESQIMNSGPKPYCKVVKAVDLFDLMVSVQISSGNPYICNGCAVNMKSNHANLGPVNQSNLCLEVMEANEPGKPFSCNLSSINCEEYVKAPIPRDVIEMYSNPITLANGQFKEIPRNKLIYSREWQMLCGRMLQQYYDFALQGKVTRHIVKTLNIMLDKSLYPLDKVSKVVENVLNGCPVTTTQRKPGAINTYNRAIRPLGIGFNGFADALAELNLTFIDYLGATNKSGNFKEIHPITRLLSKCMSASLYFNYLCKSVQLSIYDGPYQGFDGSPYSQGRLQFDLWREEYNEWTDLYGENPYRVPEDDDPIDPKVWGQTEYKLYSNDKTVVLDTIKPDWNDLKRVIRKYGTRNSLGTAQMPTATTAHLLRNAEQNEAYTDNLYSSKVLSGGYLNLNRHLYKDFTSIGIWCKSFVDYLFVRQGSIQGISRFIQSHPEYFPSLGHDYVSKKRLLEQVKYLEYKHMTMWEISQMVMLQLNADRGRYFDQALSQNYYFGQPSSEQIKTAHLISQALGNKTMMYYLRTKQSKEVDLIVDPVFIKHVESVNNPLTLSDTPVVVPECNFACN